MAAQVQGVAGPASIGHVFTANPLPQEGEYHYIAYRRPHGPTIWFGAIARKAAVWRNGRWVHDGLNTGFGGAPSWEQMCPPREDLDVYQISQRTFQALLELERKWWADYDAICQRYRFVEGKIARDYAHLRALARGAIA